LNPTISTTGHEVLGSGVKHGRPEPRRPPDGRTVRAFRRPRGPAAGAREREQGEHHLEPRITTVDNREAKILVGQKIPLIVQDVAGNPVSQLQTIGIQLKVTPHLTSEKKIIMDLHPEVSDSRRAPRVQGGLIINTSEADTRVMVDDGQTAVIGGLIRTNETTVHLGVPILKDIPLIGLLFGSKSTSKQNRELIIFVTPKLMSEASADNTTTPFRRRPRRRRTSPASRRRRGPPRRRCHLRNSGPPDGAGRPCFRYPPRMNDTRPSPSSGSWAPGRPPSRASSASA